MRWLGIPPPRALQSETLASSLWPSTSGSKSPDFGGAIANYDLPFIPSGWVVGVCHGVGQLGYDGAQSSGTPFHCFFCLSLKFMQNPGTLPILVSIAGLHP